MKEIKISPVVEADMEEIYALYKEFAAYEELEDYFTATVEDLKKLMFQENLLHMVKAQVNGETVGIAAYYYQLVSFPAKKVLFLEDIFVRESARGNGIGSLFFEKLEEISRENDCLKMEWKCLKWNEPSRKFYEQHIKAKLDEEWVIYDKPVLEK